MKLTLDIAHPPQACSPNGSHGSWMKSRNARTKVRTAARLIGKQAMGLYKLDSYSPASYRITWFYKGTPPDADNIVARCKSILDGYCDAFGVNDRQLTIAGVERVHALHRPECGTVRIAFDDGK